MKIKYFVSADIHSFYTPWRKALEQAGFDENNAQHKIIICGDAFDRGDEALETLNFLLKLKEENRLIYVRGNHEDLMDRLLSTKHPHSYDGSNGTYETIYQLAEDRDKPFDIACEIVYNKLLPLREIMVDYYETEHYIFVHSCIPNGEDWRHAHKRDWEDARWGNPFVGLNYTDKIIVHGHWHNSYYWHYAFGYGKTQYSEDAIHDICAHGSFEDKTKEGKAFIGLDTCTALSGKVNVFVVEEK